MGILERGRSVAAPQLGSGAPNTPAAPPAADVVDTWTVTLRDGSTHAARVVVHVPGPEERLARGRMLRDLLGMPFIQADPESQAYAMHTAMMAQMLVEAPEWLSSAIDDDIVLFGEVVERLAAIEADYYLAGRNATGGPDASRSRTERAVEPDAVVGSTDVYGPGHFYQGPQTAETMEKAALAVRALQRRRGKRRRAPGDEAKRRPSVEPVRDDEALSEASAAAGLPTGAK